MSVSERYSMTKIGYVFDCDYCKQSPTESLDKVLPGNWVEIEKHGRIYHYHKDCIDLMNKIEDERILVKIVTNDEHYRRIEQFISTLDKKISWIDGTENYYEAEY